MTQRAELEAIHKYVSSLPVFSDHDHHLQDSFFAEPITLDKLINSSYVVWTGFSCDGTADARKRLLDNVRYNSYFEWFEKGLQKVHGIDEELTVDNWGQISKKISARYAADPDFHWKSLLDNGYERLILDAYWDPGSDDGHPEAFVPTFRIDKFTYGYHGEVIAPNDFPVWEKYGFAGGSLDDFVQMMRSTVRSRHEQGKVAALKCAEAYNRSVSFLPDDKRSAEQAFGVHPDKITREQFTGFSNYIFNRCCELAEELDLPFQVHTGLAMLSGSQPMNFEPIIAKYPKVRFVMFHAGYPWVHQVAGLAHNYPNVLPSLTWVPTISTSAAVRGLHEFVDVSSSCNSITWGSDCWVPEESVGALLAWRFVVAKALSERISDGRLSNRRAEILARKLMYENGRSIYRAGR